MLRKYFKDISFQAFEHMSFDLKLKQGSLVLSQGRLQIVENTKKLIQDSLKDVTTTQGENKYHPTYGCPGLGVIGSVMDDSFTNQVLQDSIRNTLESKQRRQRDQSLGQKLTPGEILAAIQNIVATRNQVDPRYISVIVYILSGSLTQHQLEFGIEL